MSRIFIVISCLCIILQVQSSNQKLPLMHFDFSKTTSDGKVINSAKNKQYQAVISGKYKLQPGGILQMDGVTTRVTVHGSEDFDISRNATFTILYRQHTLPENIPLNLRMDALWAKKLSFVMSRYDQLCYGNIFDGKKWGQNAHIRKSIFKKQNWHHVAMSIEYRNNVAEAEEWVEITFYVDGMQIGRKRFIDTRINKNRNPLEIGWNSGMGPFWHLGGEIAEAKVFEGILSQDQIQQEVLSQNLAQPAFVPNIRLTKEMENQIQSAKITVAEKSAIRNLARIHSSPLSWKEVLAQPAKYLIPVRGRDSSIVLLKSEKFTHILAWFDHRTNCDLLYLHNEFIDWKFQCGKKMTTLNPFSSDVISSLEKAPYQDKEGNWHFTISYQGQKIKFNGSSRFTFRNDRLEFTHQAQSLMKNARLHTVTFPKIVLHPLTGKKEVLLVPLGSGVEYKTPRQKRSKYDTPYPRGFASMQTVSYYDETRGIYTAVEDPAARLKRIFFEANPDYVSGGYSWRVPDDGKATKVLFDPECRSAFELFRGNWYDVAQIYRRSMEEINADWWISSLPRKDGLPYVYNNNIWIQSIYTGEYPADLFLLKDYLQQKTLIFGDIWFWWEKGDGVHLSPTVRATPEWINFVQDLRKKGIYCMPYINGRLWAERDRRGKDYKFSEIGRKLNVVNDGIRLREMYSNPSDVLCPYTSGYQKIFFDYINTLACQGLDGLYVDQWGAAKQLPCQVREHGHCPSDWDAWGRKGYIKLINRLREHWRAKNTEKILATEDSSEMFVKTLDFFQPYRWNYNDQVPLFPAVYSGRIQFYNRHAHSPAARFQTVAEQFLNSEQMGNFALGELCSPLNHNLRVYVKQLLHLRTGILDFFNSGKMARPPQLLLPVKRIARYTGIFADKTVARPQVQTASWELGKMQIVMLINSENEKHSNTVTFRSPAASCGMKIYSDRTLPAEQKGHSEVIKIPFTLEPYGCMLIAIWPEKEIPEKQIAKIDHAFRIIRKCHKEQDPFMQLKYPETKPIPAEQKTSFINSALILNARRETWLNRVSYIINGAVIYPGVIDFARQKFSKLDMEIAFGGTGGKLLVFANDIRNDSLIAEIVLDAKDKTPDFNTYRQFIFPLKKQLSGKQKIIFVLSEGNGFCNLRSFKFIK